MSDTSSAIRAAKEVQADTLAPELYRQSNEWFFKAKHEYRYKNFKDAKEYARKARLYAEQAEFEALRNGATRTEGVISDPLGHEAAQPMPVNQEPGAAKPEPYDYPTPTGKPIESFETSPTKPGEPPDPLSNVPAAVPSATP